MSAPGGCLLQGGCLVRGVCAQGGACFHEGCLLLWGGVSATGGVSGLGGICSGGCLLPGGICSWGVSQHALRQTPPPCEQNDKQVQKYYLGHNFVAAGNNGPKLLHVSRLTSATCERSIL